MGKRGLIQRSACAAAMIAVALLGFAFTQSVVMQTAMAAPGVAMPLCSSTAMSHGPGSHDAGQAQKACPYCAAAAHAPLCGFEPALPRPSVLAWSTYTQRRPLGPRGPPDITPNARGPPAAPLTI